MKKGKKELQMAVVVMFLLSCSQKTQLLQVDNPEGRQAWVTTAIVAEGSSVYFWCEGEIPHGMKTLCDSPYLALRCSDLKNPYSGKSLQEDPSWIQIEPRSRSVTFRWKRFRQPFRIIGLPIVREGSFDLEVVKNWKKEEKAAFAVYFALMELQRIYSLNYNFWLKGIQGIREKSQMNPSWQELESAFPYIMCCLRNEFTGGYARVTSLPSPGDFKEVEIKQYPGSPATLAGFYFSPYGADGKELQLPFKAESSPYRSVEKKKNK